MRFYNVDNRGKFWLQRGTSLPAGTGADDEGRAFYKTDSKELYIHDDSTWNLSSAYQDVPLNTILLIESDTAISGYSLLETRDDAVVYITKGSGAGGESGGSLKSSSTWTQPSHTHTGGSHALTISEMPSHRHAIKKATVTRDEMYGAGQAGDQLSTQQYSGYSGGGSAHSHGLTSSGATTSSWRPYGFNYTRQQRT